MTQCKKTARGTLNYHDVIDCIRATKKNERIFLQRWTNDFLYSSKDTFKHLCPVSYTFIQKWTRILGMLYKMSKEG